MASTLDGPRTGMYTLKPIYSHNQQIQIPDCMYKMPDLHVGAEDSDKTKATSSNLDQLERRQEEILQRLNKLQQEVEKLAKGVKLPSLNGGGKDDSLEDIVINASPDNIPYSLFVLCELLSKQYKIMTSVHVHSSLKQVPDALKNKFAHNGLVSRMAHQMGITLIWKAVTNGPVMIVSAHKQSPIEGEASIARYLGRLLTPAYDDCDPITATEIDQWLDIASNQLLNGNKKEKAAAVKSLNARLGKNQWLAGSNLTLADIVMWSVLYQTGQVEGVPGNVKSWLKACNDNPVFARAKLHI